VVGNKLVIMVNVLPRFTFGMGDRFGHEGEAQLSAVQDAVSRGIDLCPVWNKSHREHTIVGTKPGSLREEADAAVRALRWTGDYFVDADHINLHTVAGFLDCSDFFTLDVADYVGQTPEAAARAAFLAQHAGLAGSHRLPGWDDEVVIGAADLERTADKFLGAMTEAGRIYRHIAERKKNGPFAVEVSVDETDSPQTPADIGFVNNTTEPVYKMLSVANAVPGSSTAETLIETYKDVIALDYAETFLNRAIRQAMSALSQALKRTGIEQQYIDAIRGNAQEAQRQLLTEKQAAYAKVRSVSSMTQDLQTLERQLWSSMPSSVKSMLDFSASSGARGS
jgi:hypothetical protein